MDNIAELMKEQSEKSVYIGGAIKSAGDNGEVDGYMIYFAGPGRKDVDDEYFAKATELELEWFDKRPMLFHHGGDPTMRGKSIGTINSAKVDDVGLWVEGIIDMRDKYNRAIDRMVKQGILDWSSGTLPQLVEVEDDGFIKRWPFIEGSMTPTPAMPFSKTRIHSVKGLVEASRGAIDGLFKDADGHNADEFKIVFDHDHTKGYTKMLTPEDLEIIRGVIKEEISAFSSAIADKQGLEDEEELEVAKQAMEEEAEEIIEEEMKAEDTNLEEEDEKSIKKSVRDVIYAKAADIAFAGLKAVEEHRAKHQGSIDEAVGKAADKFNDREVHYGRAKSKVGGAEYGTSDNPGKAPGQLGLAEKPGLAAFIKSAANHDFGSGRGKAQNPYIGDAGGYLLGQELRNDILPPLRANVVAFDAGVRQTNVPQGVGTITQAKMTTAPTAYRPGINTAVTAADASFDTITAFLRPIAAQTIIPFQLLEQSPLSVEQSIREEMIRSIALQIDIEILNGTGTVVSGTGAQIRGVKTVLEGDATLAASNIATLATNGRKPTFADASAAETQIAAGNVADTEPKSWIMHSRSRGRFRDLTATTGEPLFRDNFGIAAYPDLIGYPLHVGNQIPITDTTGTSTDTSEIYYGAWRYIEYVMQDALEIIVDRVTLANQLQARIIAYTYSDILIHYPEAFYVMKGVR